MNITDILTEHARNRPDHPAIEDGERIVTYGGLDRLVDGAAANLQAASIEPGDTVALHLGESADHLIILCALARAGAIIFSLNSTASKAELTEALASVAVTAVITHGSKLTRDDVRWLRATDV